MDSGSAVGERRSVVRMVSPVRPRKLAKVPFVELADGRLQGVVSSGSDIDRVYVSSIVAGTHGYSCSTNNNRPCGGLTAGSMCKHLHVLLDEAVLQYGADRIARYLQIPTDDRDDLARHLHGEREATPAATVFSRFLRHLAYLEIAGTTDPLPELHWFPATGSAR